MYKNLFVFFMTILVVLFLGLYISQMTGYYSYQESKKTQMTENAIKRFEQDLKDGKEINVKDYLEEEANYSNALSTLGMKTSRMIETLFDKTMNAIFNGISKTISNNKIVLSF